MKKFFLAILFALAPLQAAAQSVQQSGTVTVGQPPRWIANGVIGAGGASADGLLTTIGITNANLSSFCIGSARASAAGRNLLCFGAQTGGNAVISLQNYGTAAAQNLVLRVNGVDLPLPTGVADATTFWRGDGIWATPAGGGNVTGAASSTDNAIARWNATSGTIIQNSGVTIDDSNNILQSTVQEFVVANRTYFVRTDGSNSNTGLVNSAGGAWLTWQKCADVTKTLYIPVGIVVTCDGGNSGTFTGAGSGDALVLFSGWSGGGSVTLTGDTATPGNVILDANGGPVIRISTGSNIGSGMTVQGFRLVGGAGGTGRGIRHGGRGTVAVTSMEFGTEAYLQVEFGTAAINLSGTNAIVGNVTLDRFYDADVGYIQAQGTITIGGTVTMTTAFATARNNGYLFDVSATYTVTGSVTGKRFAADKDGRINTQNLGINVFPGTTAGTLATGGTYDGLIAVVGVTDGSNAPAEQVGYYLETRTAIGSAVPLTDNTSANINAGVSLTAGEWDVQCAVSFLSGSSTAVTRLDVSISTTSATLNVTEGRWSRFVGTTLTSSAENYTLHTPVFRVSLTSTTTHFCVSRGVFTVSTLSSYGVIRARRMH